MLTRPPNVDPAWRHVLLVTIAAIGLLAGCASTPPPTPASDSLQAEVRMLCQGMEEALREGDLQRVASFYADDGILLSPSGKRQGGSRQLLEQYWARFDTAVDWSLTTHSIEGVEGLVMQRGRSDISFEDDGELRVGTVEFVLIWQRQLDGSLKIAADGYW